MTVTGAELIRKLKSYAEKRRHNWQLDEAKGKGSHAVLTVGNRSTTIKDRKKEIGKGLLRSILKQLGIDPKDLV